MTDTTALHDALDRAIGPGPDGPDLPTLLHHGQRTVRRRRAGVAATGILAVVAAMGVALTVQQAAPSSSTPLAPASSGAGAPSGRLDETLHGREQVWDAQARRLRAQHSLGVGSDASLEFPPGVTVVRRVDDALGLEPRESSVAYVVRENGEEVWYFSSVRPTGPAQSTGRLVTGRPGGGRAYVRGLDRGPGPCMTRSDRDTEFAEFVLARRAHLARIAYAVCGDRHRAEDLVQTALVKLYAAWPRIRARGHEEAYARTIIVRADIDESRRPWRRERPGLDGLDPPAEPSIEPEERSALFDALQALPTMQRKTVLLRHWLGLSVSETAVELRISEGTVKSHTSRGLAALQQVLSAEQAHDLR